MAWDSTGQEGVFAWATYFNDTVTATNALNSILAYQPTVPHWGYNGNARRYWSVHNNHIHCLFKLTRMFLLCQGQRIRRKTSTY